MNAELSDLLHSIVRPPSLRDLLRQRETAALAVSTFNQHAEHWQTQKRLAQLSHAEISAKIKALYGEVP